MERKGLDYKILDVYSNELQEIKYKLQQIETGRVYDLTNIQGDGYLSHNAKQLKQMISSLLDKIQNGKESVDEEISKIL